MLKRMFIIFIFVFIPNIIFGQNLADFYLFGYVTDSTNGNPIPGVFVEVINEADPSEKYADFTDKSGRYVVSFVTQIQSLPDQVALPSEFNLLPNYPNPFNPVTHINFHIPKLSKVQLIIFNVLGQKIKTIINQNLFPGKYQATWDGTNQFGEVVSAGIYFYQLRTLEFTKTRKMILMDGSSEMAAPRKPSFYKSNRNYQTTVSPNIMVTIRATSAFITPFEVQHINISSQYFRYDISCNKVSNTILDKEAIIVSDPTAEGKVFVSGKANAILDTVLGSEKISIKNERTAGRVSMRVDYDGGFNLIELDGLEGDTLSATLLREGEPLGDSDTLTVNREVAPVVVETQPTNGEKDILIDQVIFISFSEPLQRGTINSESIFLSDNIGNVSGQLSLLNNNTVVSFNPTEPLKQHTSYTITVTIEVADLQDIPLANSYSATFTTGEGPVEGKIAFSRTEDYYPITYFSNIIVFDSDGSNLKKLTKRNDVQDGNPAWFPDGSKIVFDRGGHVVSSDNTHYWDIFIMNSDGSFIENITNTPEVDESNPAVSPDGNRIAFDSDREGNWDIYTMNINGTGIINLTNTPDIDELSPNWSLDGNKLVYGVAYNNSPSDIWIMNHDGSAKNKLVGFGYSQPSWSPDGKEIAFVYAVGVKSRIYIINSDGTGLRELTTGTISGPSWSPDGNRLVFLHFDPDWNKAIATINRDGTNLQILTPYDNNILPKDPAWSPWPLRK
jgi:TolB protein